MANGYHYYKNVHVISKDFSINEAPRTRAKAELIEASKPQYMKTLDTYASRPRDKQPIASLQRDIVNIKQLTKDLTISEHEDIKKEFYTENKVLRWVRSDPLNFRILKGEPYTIPDKKIRGRCWVIRNHDFWLEHKDEKDVIDNHFGKKLETLPLIKEEKEDKDELKIPFTEKENEKLHQLDEDHGAAIQYEKGPDPPPDNPKRINTALVNQKRQTTNQP